MRFIPVFFKMASVSLTLAALFACSNGSSTAPPAIDGAGKHVVAAGYTSWAQQHWVEYRLQNGDGKFPAVTTNCSECHGADLTGGTSRVSCFSASFGGMECHANSDGSFGHPSSWGRHPEMSSFHAFSNFNGKPVKGSTTLVNDCGGCHAIDSLTLMAGSAPSCISKDATLGIACHSASPAATSTGCVSCHSTPPGTPPGAGSTPNRPGAHDTHLSLGIGCNVCHTNGGSGTVNHAAGHGVAYMKLAPGYAAETGGVFRLIGDSCANVACHGGQTTPDWFSGSLALETDCTSCHRAKNVSIQFNSYTSVIEHNKHLIGRDNPRNPGSPITCTDCHDNSANGTLVTRHLTNIGSHTFLGPQETINANLSYQTRSCLANDCHFAPLVDEAAKRLHYTWK